MSLILSENDLLTSLQRISATDSTEELIEDILRLYLDIFPAGNACLFRYSSLCHIAEGIISIDSKGLDYIHSIRDDVKSIPAVHAAIIKLAAVYIPKRECLKQLGTKYMTFTEPIHSLIIIPIFSGTVVFGYIISYKFNDCPIFDHELLSQFTQFGRLVGTIFNKDSKVNTCAHLSKREIEVMSMLANGEIIKQVADSLEISEATIKQYIKSAIKKLGVKNRTQAVAELIRLGIIL